MSTLDDFSWRCVGKLLLPCACQDPDDCCDKTGSSRLDTVNAQPTCAARCACGLMSVELARFCKASTPTPWAPPSCPPRAACWASPPWLQVRRMGCRWPRDMKLSCGVVSCLWALMFAVLYCHASGAWHVPAASCCSALSLGGISVYRPQPPVTSTPHACYSCLADPKALEEQPSQYLLQFESSDISRLRADVQSLGFASLVT